MRLAPAAAPYPDDLDRPSDSLPAFGDRRLRVLERCSAPRAVASR